jgi:hypothetical protein
MKMFPCLALAMFGLISAPALADINGDMAAGLPAGQVLGNAVGGNATKDNAKAAVKGMVVNGADAGEVARVALGLGFDPESVIAGAIEGGADVAKVVRAALAYGLDPDKVAQYCKNAGADPQVVASAIAAAVSEGEAYASSGTTGQGSLSAIPSGGGGGGGGNISNNK